MSLFVDDVVGQFQLVERQRPTHPVLTAGWRVRVHMQLSANDRLVGLARYDPPVVLVLVAIAVDRYDVDHDDVVDVRVESSNSQLQRREHAPDIVTSHKIIAAYSSISNNSRVMVDVTLQGRVGDTKIQKMRKYISFNLNKQATIQTCGDCPQ